MSRTKHHESQSHKRTSSSSSSIQSYQSTPLPKKLNHETLPSHKCRIFLILLGFIHCMLASGMIFGWASLELVLRHEGVYAHLCENSTMVQNGLDTGYRSSHMNESVTVVLPSAPEKQQWYTPLGSYSEQRLFSNMIEGFAQVHHHDLLPTSQIAHSHTSLQSNAPPRGDEEHRAVSCDERSFMFEQIFTAGAVAVNLAQLFSGFFLDFFGPKITCVTSSLILIAGLLLFGFSNDTNFQAFIPAYVLIGIGGPPIQLAVLHLSNLYPSWKAMIKSVVSGLFGLSSLIFFLFFLVHEYLDVKRMWIFVGYCAVIVIIMLSGLVFWPMKAFLLDEVILLELEKKRQKINEDTLYVDDSDFVGQSVNASRDKDDNDDIINESSESKVIPFSPLVRKSFLRQLISFEMFFMVIFMCVSVLRLNYFAGTMDTQLYEKSQNDREGAELAAKVFSLIASCGFVGIPLIGILLDKAGLFVSYVLVASTNFLYNLLFLVPYNATWFEAIIFVFYSVSRPFIYASKYAYISDVFGFANFGKLVGICNFSIGVFTTLQFLINYIIKEVLKGTHFWANVAFAGSGVVAYLFPLFILIKTLQWRLWRNKQHKAQDATRSPLLGNGHRA